MTRKRNLEPEQKTAMMAAGVWGAFVAKRTKLTNDGMKPAAANRQCLDEFLPKDLDVSQIDVSKLKQPSVGNKQDAKNLAEYEAGQVGKVFGDDGREVKAPGDYEGDAEVSAWNEAVANHSNASGVSVEAQVLWVMDSIDNPSIKGLEDSPCPSAWTLLRMCRNEREFCSKFVLSIYSRMLPKDIGAKKDDDDGHFDGDELVNHLDEITQIANKAKMPAEAI